MVRTFQNAALALAFAVSVTAQNTPPPVPEDAQIGLLHFPVTCQIYGFLNQTFDTVFSATAPVFGGTGQQIYYTDVVGHIDIPSYITGLAPFVGATQAQANVTVALRLTNASPSTLQIYKATLNNIQFPTNGDGNIRIPQGTGTLPPLGPVTLGAANTAHRIFLGAVSVILELQDSTGKGVFGPIPVTCGQQNIDFVIGSVDINSTTGLPPAAPSNGFVPSFPSTPELVESGSFRFPYDCNFGPLGPQTVDLTIGGSINTYFNPGEKFYLSNAQSFIRVPESLVSLALSAYPSLSTFDTTINTVDILFSNANPSVFNAASTPLESKVQVKDTGNGLIIPVPYSGYLNPIGPITAGAAGNIVGVAVGNTNATAVLRDSSGNALLTLPITCQPPSPLELIGVPITNQQPGNYKLGSSQSGTPTGAAAGAPSTSSAALSIPTFA